MCIEKEELTGFGLSSSSVMSSVWYSKSMMHYKKQCGSIRAVSSTSNLLYTIQQVPQVILKMHINT